MTYTTQLIIYAALSVLNGIMLFSASLKFMLVLQQCGYHGKKYFKWLAGRDTPYLSRLMLLCLLGFLFFCVLSMCFAPVIGGDIAQYLGLLSYVFFTIIYINTESSVNAKVPLKKTKRLLRLCVTFIIVLSAISFGFFVLFNYIATAINDDVVKILRFSLICGMPILSPYILFLAYCINEPFEWIIRTHYINAAKEKIKNLDLIKIGITGSYGKTTVKEILKTILSQKFRVFSTPASYNTPMGISRSVKNLDVTHDIFIAEMGARSKGDIKELAEMVRPSIGILTGINTQHLESFKTIENTKNTKFELFENLTEGGKGFFSTDNEGARELFERFNGEKYAAGLTEGGLIYASDISCGIHGTEFTLHVLGEKSVKCTTVLLGRHSISNICLAAAVAYKLGMTAEEIAAGINRIQSVGHRLEVVPNSKDIVIIDDSYNSNVDGISAAMEVLDAFSGRKIVVTPGLVELGKIENVTNFEFGKTLSKHADIVIIVGKHNAEMIINGLIEGGFNKENVIFSKNLKRGNDELNSIIKKGDVVLFENDLPDNYN